MATIIGTAGPDTLTETSGADTIDALGGDDTIILDKGGTSETVAGGDGNDRLVIDARTIKGAVRLNVPALDPTGPSYSGQLSNQRTITYSDIENFTIFSSLDDYGDTVTTGDGDDVFYHHSVNSTIENYDTVDLGGGSNDLLIADFSGVVSYTVSNELPTDDSYAAFFGTKVGSSTYKLKYKGAESLQFIGGALDDSVTGFVGNDILEGRAGNDSLKGGNGDDMLDGGIGDDVMTGGSGNDIYFVGSVADVVNENAGEGTDEVRAFLANYSLAGTNLENLTAANAVAHDFRGSTANNVVTGGGGNDFLRLQDGGVDSAKGGGGDDVILFGSSMTGTDSADGGAGADQLVLQGGGPLTFGTGVVGIEALALLSGLDTRFGDTAGNHYDYNLTTVNANVAAGARLTVDASALAAGEDLTFNGSAESDGSFFIYGGGGVDRLTGGGKNDVFLFGAQGQWGSSDVVTGGAGIDQLALRGNYSIAFGAGQLAGIESIALLSAHDTRFGALGTNYSYVLTMNDGNVAAGAQLIFDAAQLRGTETLVFDGSAETNGSFLIFGGLNGDSIAGSRGADTIQGGGGADALTGGAGADSFRYASTLDSTAGAADHILDFTPGTDKIDLAKIDANSFSAGNQAFHWIGATAFAGTGAASAGELRAFLSSGSWFVEGDADGDGHADLVIQLTTPAAIPVGQSDFLL
jgi:Ca2+-binding RTX toxin-like protein